MSDLGCVMLTMDVKMIMGMKSYSMGKEESVWGPQ